MLNLQTYEPMAEYQEIIVIVIIALAIAFAGFKIYRSLTDPLKGCTGCESDCSGCQLQDLKKQIEENKK
ncbi:MAG: FeoB-associated Cys-rich membrane protein [Lentimicrobium sp.]|nr:FeoB-associated Cys-rich membrane protein [Lentimicrobium sp.]